MEATAIGCKNIWFTTLPLCSLVGALREIKCFDDNIGMLTVIRFEVVRQELIECYLDYHFIILAVIVPIHAYISAVRSSTVIRDIPEVE